VPEGGVCVWCAGHVMDALHIYLTSISTVAKRIWWLIRRKFRRLELIKETAAQGSLDVYGTSMVVRALSVSSLMVNRLSLATHNDLFWSLARKIENFCFTFLE
jgi:hypothetical protein